MGKLKFEGLLWNQAEVESTHFHGDNGIFTVDMFQKDCDKKNQYQSFSVVGAPHQNDKAKRDIQTIMNMARTFMVHVSLHWTYHKVDDLSLW